MSNNSNKNNIKFKFNKDNMNYKIYHSIQYLNYFPIVIAIICYLLQQQNLYMLVQCIDFCFKIFYFFFKQNFHFAVCLTAKIPFACFKVFLKFEKFVIGLCNRFNSVAFLDTSQLPMTAFSSSVTIKSST